MANFEMTASPLAPNASGNAWVDPPSTLVNAYGSLAIPTRQNTKQGLPHRYMRFLYGSTITVQLNPTGTSDIVPDTSLGGKLFLASFVEVPTGIYSWSAAPGYSSYQWFMPLVRGAFCALFTRDGGGGIVWHFMVE